MVVKDATPNDPQDFSFTAGGGLSPASFSLDDDADGTLAATRTFTDLVRDPATRSPRACRAGWDQTSATCDDGSAVSNITLSAGEIVTCTFANRKRGEVVVVEDAVPDDAQDFDFTAGGGLSPTSFSLDDDADGDAPRIADLQRRRARRGYSLSQTPPCRLGPRSRRRVTTAAPSRTSTSPRARPSRARSRTSSRAASRS